MKHTGKTIKGSNCEALQVEGRPGCVMKNGLFVYLFILFYLSRYI